MRCSTGITTVLAAFCFLGSSASADEFLLDTTIVYTHSACSQGCLGVCGSGLLAVWCDLSRAELVCARVSAGGVVLDSSGFTIARHPASNPAVASDGANCLVVWNDPRRGNGDIYGARVAPDCTVLEPDGFAICTAGGSQEYAQVVFDGTNYLVVWQDQRSGCDIYAARVSATGTVLDPDGFPVSTESHDQLYPRLAVDNANSLIVWCDMRLGDTSHIYGCRVSRSGTVLDPNGLSLVTEPHSSTQGRTSLGFDGTNYLLAWEDCRDGDYDNIRAARVTPSGTVLDPGGFIVSDADDDQWSPVVGFDGTNFLVAWSDHRNNPLSPDLYAARVTRSGTVLDTAGIPVLAGADDQWIAGVVFPGPNYFLAWLDARRTSYDLLVGRLTTGGTVLDTNGIYVAFGASPQTAPAAASDGTNHLVVWQDSRTGDPNILCARVSQSGIVLDPVPIAIPTVSGEQVAPKAAFDGSNYLVVWEDNDNILGSRVTPDGVVVDTTAIRIYVRAYPQTQPAVAFNGTNYLVAWLHRTTSDDVHARIVSPAGVVDTHTIRLTDTQRDERYPAIGSDGTNWLVVWGDADFSAPRVCGARVSPTGVVLDSPPVVIADTASYPSLAFDGANYLVAWTAWNPMVSHDIYATRVTPTGTVLDPEGIPLACAPDEHEWQPTTAFSSGEYTVVWQQAPRDPGLLGHTDLHGSTVSPAGAVTSRFAVVRRAGPQEMPALVRSTNGLFLTYRGWAEHSGNRALNCPRIWGKTGPLPGTQETSNAELRTLNVSPTIIRGLLELDSLPTAEGSLVTTGLYDVNGRKMLDLRAGPNDVSRLAPGVYFVHPASGPRRPASSVTRVVLTR